MAYSFHDSGISLFIIPSLFISVNISQKGPDNTYLILIDTKQQGYYSECLLFVVASKLNLNDILLL